MCTCHFLVEQAGHQKIKEGVGVWFEAGVGVRLARRDSGEALVVYFDVQWCGGAGLRVDRISGGDYVEHGWSCLLGVALPFCGENLQGIGEWCADRCEERAFCLVKLQLGRVERHHVDGHA